MSFKQTAHCAIFGFETRKDVGADCRHVVRPSVQLPSVYCYSGALWRTSLYFLLATTMVTLIVVEVFNVR